MSSISGIVGLAGTPVETAWIEQMAAAAAGGTWTTGVWTSGAAALAGCAPESDCGGPNGSQPRLSEDGRHALVFDGRLDNRSELADALGDEAPGVESRSDAELVLAAYRRWSSDCTGRLLGDFAFAVWDRRLQRLFCARDVCGARPFYYVCNSRFFAFASTEEALIRLPGVSRRPAPELLAFYLVRTFQDVEPDQSWLEDVKILLPAHSVTIAAAGMAQPAEYWSFERGPVLRLADGGDYRAAFLDVFGKAVSARMRVGRPPAAILSGGMDSAGLAAMAGRLVTSKPRGAYHAYSAVADESNASLESRSIRSITSAPQVAAHYLQVPSLTGIANFADLEDAAWRHAHPVSNAILITALMCAAASRDGRRFLQHAPSGDAAMGYWPGYLNCHARHGRWRVAWREARAAARHHTFLEGQSAGRLLLRGTWHAFAPAALRAFVRRHRTSPSGEPDGLRLLNPDFVDSLKILERIGSPLADGVTDDEEHFRQRHAESTFGPWGVAGDLAGGQRVGSRYGIDLSDPWADRRVLEFFLHLPVDYLFRHGWTKYLARTAFAPDLEDWVRFRSDKEHLGWMLVHRLMRESREFIDQAFNDELELIGEYVDLRHVRDLHRQYGSSGDLEIGDRIFSLMTLLQWVKRLSAPQA